MTVKAVVDRTGDVGRTLLRALLICATVVVAAVAAMVGAASDSLAAAAAVAGPFVAFGVLMTVGQAASWRSARERRRLRRRVGDPLVLSGDWRRLLGAAWAARDDYVGAVAAHAASPVGERLRGQQPIVDAALERCGELARCGDQLFGQLRQFRPRRLRRELVLERRRDRNGARAQTLARQLDDVARLRADLRRVQLELEDQVHDLRTAAWRASTLRSGTTAEPDPALGELLDDLAHLREALDEVERPQPRAAAIS